MVGIYFLKDLGLVKLSIKSTILGGNIIGGLMFGLGWGLLGYCPGTSAGALGEGRWDAIWGIGGMLFGAAIYAEVYPLLKETVLKWGDFGKITLPEVLGINHWIIIILFVICGTGLLRWFDKKNLEFGDWERQIYRQIAHTDVFVLCLSSRTAGKAAGKSFLSREIQIAIRHVNIQPPGSTLVIPVKLDVCELPDHLSRWQCIELFRRSGYERLVSGLRNHARALAMELPR